MRNANKYNKDTEKYNASIFIFKTVIISLYIIGLFLVSLFVHDYFLAP